MEFRVARHTDDLNLLIAFYRTILNFEILGQFKDHANYDGVFLGRKNLNWHLEFTSSASKAQHQFDEDDILVFYPESRADYNSILQNISQNNIKTRRSKNPYWADNGIMIQDPDAFNIIVSDLKIQK